MAFLVDSVQFKFSKLDIFMVREIVLYGHPVLRKKCAPVTEVTEEIETLAKDMVETMIDAEGVGLAAPQVAEQLQLAVVDVTGAENACTYLRVDGKDTELEDLMPLIFINPELELSRNRELDFEGCLSIPDLREKVNRPAEVGAHLTLLDGRQITVEADGLLARAIQHEVDHLNGILFIDRLSTVAKIGAKKRLRILQAEWAEED